MNRFIFAACCLAFGFLNVLLFYRQSWGINLAIFEVPLLLLLIIFNKKALNTQVAKLAIIGCFCSMAAVVVAHTPFAIALHCCFFILMGGLALQPIKNPAYLFFGAIEKIGTLFTLPFKNYVPEKKAFKPTYVLRLSVVPLLVILLFVSLYALAVPRFGKWVTNFIAFFPNINFAQFWLIAAGTFLAAFVLYVSQQSYFANKDGLATDTLTRKRKKTLLPRWGMGLKKEHLSAIIMLVGLNALIATINILDISTYWFSYSPQSYEDMKFLVHEGTYLLIVCILLSVTIALYFFRGNMNFYSKNRLLRQLVMVWLAQNALMVFSVAWRNYWYIADYNLAYKRIGVLVFLAATLFGIVSTIIKINRKKSMYYLLRVNSTFILLLLLPLAFIRWDAFIARYNLKHQNAYVHKNFLANMNDAALPELLAHKDFFDKPMRDEFESEYSYLHSFYADTDTVTFTQAIEIKADDFVEEFEKQHWLSFNLADYHAAQQLKQMGY